LLIAEYRKQNIFITSMALHSNIFLYKTSRQPEIYFSLYVSLTVCTTDRMICVFTMFVCIFAK